MYIYTQRHLHTYLYIATRVYILHCLYGLLAASFIEHWPPGTLAEERSVDEPKSVTHAWVETMGDPPPPALPPSALPSTPPPAADSAALPHPHTDTSCYRA